MFALVRQVQIATDQAKNGSARLAGVKAPSYEDNETTMDELKTRIARTIAYLKTLDPKQIDSSADRERHMLAVYKFSGWRIDSSFSIGMTVFSPKVE